MNILAIESSCDETAAAVVRDGVDEIAGIIATSKAFHEKTGGIVPEVAARKQVESIIPVINEALQRFSEKEGVPFDVVLKTGKGIDAIAVTVGPGLAGSLVVGIEAAKALALAWNKPLIPVNHLIGHIYSNFIGFGDRKPSDEIKFPAVAMVVSGGHTDLVLMKGHGDFEYLGGTLDDAAGEAFDKTARLLNLSKYLGGVLLSKKAAECTENTLQGKLPRPMINDNTYDFSFSGLKTAVKRMVENSKNVSGYSTEALACEFETAVTDVLVTKIIKAAKEFNAKSVLLGGGVSANQVLRSRLAFEAEILDIPVFVPELRMCGDNAVYIATAAYFLNKQHSAVKDFSDVKVVPSLGILDRV